MPRRQLGVLLAVVGIAAILVAVLADPLGIGGKEDTFGWKQIVLLAVGVALAVAGALVGRRGASPP
jgi:hypothetical protein